MHILLFLAAYLVPPLLLITALGEWKDGNTLDNVFIILFWPVDLLYLCCLYVRDFFSKNPNS